MLTLIKIPVVAAARSLILFGYIYRLVFINLELEDVGKIL